MRLDAMRKAVDDSDIEILQPEIIAITKKLTTLVERLQEIAESERAEAQLIANSGDRRSHIIAAIRTQFANSIDDAVSSTASADITARANAA